MSEPTRRLAHIIGAIGFKCKSPEGDGLTRASRQLKVMVQQLCEQPVLSVASLTRRDCAEQLRLVTRQH